MNTRTNLKWKGLLTLAALASFFFFTSCQESDVFDNGPEPLITTANNHGNTIPGRYIVVYNPDVLNESGMRLGGDYDEMQAMLSDYSKQMMNENAIDPAAIEHVYSNMIQGFSASLSNEQLTAIRGDRRVKYVEEDRIIIMRPPWEGGGGGGGGGSSSQVTPWGITRVGGPVNYTGSNRA